jgi:undecaprenyl-phosphate galactose phosphotransferase
MSILQKHPKYKWAIAITDYISLTSGIILSIILLEVTTAFDADIYSFEMLTLLIVAFFYSGIQILVFQILDLYHIQNIKNSRTSFILLLKGCAFTIPILSLLTLALPIEIPVFEFFILTSVTSLGLLVLLRKLCVLVMMNTLLLSDRVIIIGGGVKGQSMADTFSGGLLKKTIGFMDDNIRKGEIINGIPVLGKIFDSHLIANKEKADFFVMAIDNISRDHFYQVLSYFNDNNLIIYISSNHLNVLQKNIHADQILNYSLIRIGNTKQSISLVTAKRLFDIVGSAMGIFFFSPIFIFLAIAIKMTSKGPFIYQQIRIGRKGHPFTFYKFRSMRINSDLDSTRNEKVIRFIKGEATSDTGTKIVNHSFITPIGRIIRKTSLDELPQLFNVLKGDMSLVGPRPCLPSEWDVYGSWQKQRLMYMPGCTGIWQVSGRSKVNFEETVLMDVYYNCNVSLWLDFKILLNTIPVMIFYKGGE